MTAARSPASRWSTRCATRAAGALFASTTSPFYGPKSSTPTTRGEWEQADGVALPEGGDAALERIWVVVAGEADGLLYAGGDPGVLFTSRDGGPNWELNEALWSHPTRPTGSRAAAGSACTR